MAKVRTRTRARAVGGLNVELNHSGPGRLQGASVAAGNGPSDLGQAAFFVDAAARISLAGSAQVLPDAPAPRSDQRRSVRLSDGTEITFAATDPLTIPEPV